VCPSHLDKLESTGTDSHEQTVPLSCDLASDAPLADEYCKHCSRLVDGYKMQSLDGGLCMLMR
jgi:hypothetical protein